MTKTRRAGFRKKRRGGGRKTVKRKGGKRRSRVTKRGGRRRSRGTKRRGGGSRLGYFGAPEGGGLELFERGLRGGVGRHILLLVTLFHEDGFS